MSRAKAPQPGRRWLLAGLGAAALAGPGMAATKGGLALIYRGPGGCAGCAEALGAVARRVGLRVAYVTPPEVTPASLAKAAVYIQGGGDDVDVIAEALGPGGHAALRAYVDGGGRYWGICAGAYLAGRTRDDAGRVPGLRLFDGDSFPYSPFAARVETVIWRGTPRRMYVQEAPGFTLDDGAAAQILARYANGDIAALTARFGQGRVALSGPHPEATQGWLDADGLHEPALAPPALADQMLRALLRQAGDKALAIRP